MKQIPNIRAVAELLPDYLGFIFYPSSPRFVGELPPTALAALPATIEKVGVFVNETIAQMQQIVMNYQFRTLQLHGDESPATCQYLRQQGYQVIKAFHIDSAESIQQIANYQNAIDFALLDTKGKNLGGNGIAFDWKLLEIYTFDLPFFLSGGIGLAHIKQIKELNHPKLVAIDINSQFELSAGLKDVEKLSMLLKSIR